MILALTTCLTSSPKTVLFLKRTTLIFTWGPLHPRFPPPAPLPHNPMVGSQLQGSLFRSLFRCPFAQPDSNTARSTSPTITRNPPALLAICSWFITIWHQVFALCLPSASWTGVSGLWRRKWAVFPSCTASCLTHAWNSVGVQEVFAEWMMSR